MSEALVYRDISVRYRAGEPEVVRNVSLCIGSRERVALLGLNGSGKTTLLCAAAGLLPFTGDIAVCGIPLSQATERAVRDKLGFLFGVPDDQILFPNVMEDVAFSLERRGVAREKARAKASEVMTLLGIGDLASFSPHHLSQGQRQRVALAGALVSAPPLLLLDEPSASLDPVGKEELAGLLDEQEAAMLVATHDLGFARRVCRRFVMLDAGAIIEDTADPACVVRYEEARVAASRERRQGAILLRCIAPRIQDSGVRIDFQRLRHDFASLYRALKTGDTHIFRKNDIKHWRSPSGSLILTPDSCANSTKLNRTRAGREFPETLDKGVGL